MYETSDIRKGLKVTMDGVPFEVTTIFPTTTLFVIPLMRTSSCAFRTPS